MVQTLGSVAVGSIVKLKENGAAVNYIVVHQGKPSSLYDDSCDGTWILRQDISGDRVWDRGSSNVLETSDIQTYLNTWINRYDSNIRGIIKQVKIPYRKNGGTGTDQTGANGLSCKAFLLSVREVGCTNSENPYFPNDGSKLDYFEYGDGTSARQKRVAKKNGSDAYWWLRSPDPNYPNGAWGVYSGGYVNTSWKVTASYGLRPAMVLQGTAWVLDDGSIFSTLPAPDTLDVPIQAMQGNQISISWVAFEGADSYILERKANTDSDWVQVYSGANTSFSETVGSTWTTVQYRVKAGVSGTYGDYNTSDTIPVFSASALVISGTDGDLGTVINDIQYSISTDTGNQITATITVNGAVIFSGNVGNSASDVIPVLDLVNGEGTIVIEASVQATGGPASAVRTWTYTKSPITFPNAGSVAQLTQQGANIWPKTLAECVRLPGGKTLDEVTAFPCQVYIGSYMGTGTYGAENPCVVNLPFKPLAFTVSIKDVGSGNTIYGQLIWLNGNETGGSYLNSSNTGICTLQWGETSVSWYSSAANFQLNVSGYEYQYMAIG